MQSGTIRADDHGLEDPFKDARTLAPPNGRAQAPLQHLMQQQPEQKLGKFQTNSHQPQSFSLIDDDWVQPPMPQRSQSVTHAEMQELQAEESPQQNGGQAPLPEAPSRGAGLFRSFSRRRKKADKTMDSDAPSSSETSAHAAPVSMQRTQSTGLPIGRRRPVSAAVPTLEVLDGAGRKLKSGGKDGGSGGKDRPTSAVAPRANGGEALEVVPRAKSGTEAPVGRQWNPFKRAAPAAAPAPANPPLLGAGSVEYGNSTAQSGSSEDSRRNSVEDAHITSSNHSSQPSSMASASPFAASHLVSAQDDVSMQQQQQQLQHQQQQQHLPAPAAPAAVAGTAEKEGKEGKKGGHRRARSISSIGSLLKLKGRRSSVTGGEDLSDAKVALEHRPKTPDAAKKAAGASGLGCFGGPADGIGDGGTAIRNSTDGDDRETLLPPGLVGLRNIGNTCFVNAAMQCLRHTPGLPLALLPDLLTATALEASAPTTPRSQAGSTISRHASQQDMRGESPPGSGAPSAAGDSPWVGAPATATTAAATSAAALPLLGVVANSAQPVSSLTAPDEALEAMPENAPLQILVHQSPVLGAETSGHSGANDATGSSPSAESAATTTAAVPLPAGTPAVQHLMDAAPGDKPPPVVTSPFQPVAAAAAQAAVSQPTTPSAPAPIQPPQPELSPYQLIKLNEAKAAEAAKSAMAHQTQQGPSPPQQLQQSPLPPQQQQQQQQQQSPLESQHQQQHEQQQQGSLEGGPAVQPVRETLAFALNNENRQSSLSPVVVGAAASPATSAPADVATPPRPVPVPVRPPPPPPPPPLEKGELLGYFKRLVREVYAARSGAQSVDPTYLIRRLGPLGAPLGQDFTDGGQHDCEEVLSAIIDRLHEDLNRVEAPEEEQDMFSGEEGKAPPGSGIAALLAHSMGAPPSPITPSALSRSSHHRLMMAEGLTRESLAMDKDGGYQLRPRLSTSSMHSGMDDASLHGSDVAAGTAATPAPDQPKDDPNESEDDKAKRMWDQHLSEDDSPVTDLFGGQLQGNILCHGCKGRFTRYEFFKGLSLPLGQEARSGLSGWFSSRPPPSHIIDCLNVFTADETLSGKEKEEYYQCDKCHAKRAATIYMRIHRFPRILMLHIKRFRYAGTTREKVTTNVAFPLKGLRLGPYGSEEAAAAAGGTWGPLKGKPKKDKKDPDGLVGDGDGDGSGGPEYDLYAVINHFGTLTGGHYTATCRAPGTKESWHTFNDEVVTKTPPASVATANAYILFYVRRGG